MPIVIAQILCICAELFCDARTVKELMTRRHPSDHRILWSVLPNLAGIALVISLHMINGNSYPQAAVGIFAIVLLIVTGRAYQLKRKYAAQPER